MEMAIIDGQCVFIWEWIRGHRNGYEMDEFMAIGLNIGGQFGLGWT